MIPDSPQKQLIRRSNSSKNPVHMFVSSLLKLKKTQPHGFLEIHQKLAAQTSSKGQFGKQDQSSANLCCFTGIHFLNSSGTNFFNPEIGRANRKNDLWSRSSEICPNKVNKPTPGIVRLANCPKAEAENEQLFLSKTNDRVNWKLIMFVCNPLYIKYIYI
jgi:hypothetical protein